MRNELPRHVKIRFRRDDIAKLDELPSAAPVAPTPLWLRLPRMAARAMLIAAFGAGALILLAAVLVYVGTASGIGHERLRRAAENAITAMAGADMSAAIGGTRITIASDRFLALEVSDVEIASDETGEVVADIGTMQFGVRFLPMLRGELKLGSASLGDARILAASMPRAEQERRSLPVYNSLGLVDPDQAAALIFQGTNRLFDALERGATDAVELRDVELTLPSAAGGRTFRVDNAVLSSPGLGALEIAAELDFNGRTMSVAGSASRNYASKRIANLILQITSPEPETESPDVGFFPGKSSIGGAEISLSGTQAGGTDRLSVSARFDNAVVGLSKRDELLADLELKASTFAGADKIEIERLRIASGRSNWSFHGAVGPTPDVEGESEPLTYRYELVSDGSTIVPQDSPEPALQAVARLSGHYDVAGRLLTIEEIGVRSARGEVMGAGAVQFEPGKTPGLTLEIDVMDMPVGEVKQLWPWFGARGARRWVLNNVFGGEVATGEIELSVPPGRMGNGVPFGEREISGSVVLSDARFDVAGRLPPVRDSNGKVDFRGTDVDVTLSSGTVFMAGNKTVGVSDGTLTIRDAHEKPVLGKLAIGVAGSADAVMQLASYDPIDVDRFIDLKPDDLTGDVKGRVLADIPLQSGIPVESLGWQVSLDYEGLSIAKPFEGQEVSDADGSIAVDPTKAVIKAEAMLNGAPAQIDMVEPLGRSEVERERLITLQLDDKARATIAPGVNLLLSGPAEVEVDDSKQDRRAISANLAETTLSVPWVGWSKGGGVPAKVSFVITSEGERTELADFKLTGETFGATGSISLADGGVSRIRFPSAKLNRSDDFSVDIAAKGRGYDVKVRGSSIDARSVVKLYSKDSAAASGGGGGGGDPVPVTVDLEVASMTGFHGENLSDVSLSYRGTGSRTDVLEFSATTDGGAKVTFSDRREGEVRTVSMRSADAGSILRFLDIYEHMEGGDINLALRASGDAPLSGQLDARDFWVVNEPRLGSMVSTPTPNDGRTLNQAIRGEIDVSRVFFERGFALIEKGNGYLNLERGALRGPLIGSTFQGSLYDAEGNMSLTGTFMPVYGLNRIFGAIPLVGQILGNGRDRGLIGITFKLAGKASEPQLQVNPLSIIAPGIFRSVFEFR